MTNGRIRIRERVVFRPMEGSGGVLLDLDSGEYRQLNLMGATIWALLQDAPSREELLSQLRDRIEDAPDYMAEEVDRFLDALQERNLIGFDDVQVDAPAD